MLAALTQSAARDPSILVGTETGDDAAVYQVRADLAMVTTVDFITPVLDDPHVFGRIAAANSISDIYAMGARPVSALNALMVPKGLPHDVAAGILQGGHDEAAEAGVAVLGGHSVESKELFYGLSVTGLVHPDRIVRNSTAQAGDVLVLTKPIGTGLVINGYRKGVVSDARLREVARQMMELNRDASELMVAHGAHAATDVTGFGLAGHALGMALGAGLTFRFSLQAIPRLDDALDLLARGVTTGATTGNRKWVSGHVRRVGRLPEGIEEVLYDPQTSGGLLVALPPVSERPFVEAMEGRGRRAWRIGETVAPAPREVPSLELVP